MAVVLPAMLAIQATSKETRYNGDRFRSRLEARWAVFFHTLGIRYWYEYQDYNSGKYRYLPDFWLPEWKCFVEIKPTMPSPYECEKAIRLCKETELSVVILAGNIWPGEYQAFIYSPNYRTKEESLWYHQLCDSSPDMIVHWRSPNHVMHMSEICDLVDLDDYQRGFSCAGPMDFAECPKCGKISIGGFNGCEGCMPSPQVILKGLATLRDDIDLLIGASEEFDLFDLPIPSSDLPKIKSAFIRAREARFEHGERP